MHILLVQENADLGRLWESHLQREGHTTERVGSYDDAVEVLNRTGVDIIVLNVILEGGGALAVADYASFRQPQARVVFVTTTTFFSDGSIFAHAQNACACLPGDTDPSDLAMVVSHYGAMARSA